VWSPDGARLAFVSNRLSTNDIYLMNVNGDEAIRFTDSNGNYPAWSPDGTRLAFTSKRGQKVELFVLGLNGRGLTQLTFFPAHAASPAWSPDGTHIIFASDNATDVAVSNPEQNELYIMNADGTGIIRLTENEFNDSAPAWAP
jgi:TolB protein